MDFRRYATYLRNTRILVFHKNRSKHVQLLIVQTHAPVLY